MTLPPIQKKTSFTIRANVLAVWSGSTVSLRCSNHSRQITSKAFAAFSVFVAFCAQRCSPGLLPAASSFLASSRLILASFRPTSEYVPKESSFSLPLNLYFSRQYFEPFSVINRNSPFSSDNLYGLSVGLAVRIAVSDKAVGGISLGCTSTYPGLHPHIPPDCNRHYCSALDVKKARTLEFNGVSGSLCTALNHCLVPKKGLEPPHLSAPEPKSGASTNFATWASGAHSSTLCPYFSSPSNDVS